MNLMRLMMMKTSRFEFERKLYCFAEDAGVVDVTAGSGNIPPPDLPPTADASADNTDDVSVDVTADGAADSDTTDASADASSVNTDITEGDESSASSDGEESDAADAALFGAPEEGYGEFTIPDGLMPPTDQVLGEWKDLASGLNLSQEGAQKLVDFVTKHQSEAHAGVDRVISQARQHWKDELVNDPNIGGPKLQQSVASARTAYEGLPDNIGKQFLADMKAAGLGSLPSVIKMGVLMSQFVSEGDGMITGLGGSNNDDRPLAERMFPNAEPG